MREIFAPKPRLDPEGPVFYTITPADVGKTVIETEIGPIRTEFMGRVLKGDVGKRIYRMPAGVSYDGKPLYVWQVENDHQYARRMERDRSR